MSTSPHYESDRPRWNNGSVLARAASALASQLGPECSGPAAEKDLAQAMSLDGTTYELARSLDHAGWMIDDKVLEALGEVESFRSDAHRELVAEWVVARRVKPQRDVGAIVSIPQRGKPAQSGEITSIDLEQATYTVCCSGLGHIREGSGTHGIIVPYESVHALCPAPEVFELEIQ